MLSGLPRPAVLLTSLALTLPACAPYTPVETTGPGPFANGNAAAAASQITRAANATTGESFATGTSVNVAATATVRILATHQASERQRQIAATRAREAVQKLLAPTKRIRGTKPTAKRRIPRYLAVETVKDAQTVPQAQKVVMIWDTQANDMVGNNVYDIATPPPVGATSRFETYSAEYVGAGL